MKNTPVTFDHICPDCGTGQTVMTDMNDYLRHSRGELELIASFRCLECYIHWEEQKIYSLTEKTHNKDYIEK